MDLTQNADQETEHAEEHTSSKIVPFPYEIVDLDRDLNQSLRRDFAGEKNDFVRVEPIKYCFPGKYRQEAALYYNFPVRQDDIWVVTFPRSGTTLTQEMVWLLANNLDYEQASQVSLRRRFNFLEFNMLIDDDNMAKLECQWNNSDNSVHASRVTGGRRFFKTHLPFSLLPPKLIRQGCKVIYVARNPADVVVSFYHFTRLLSTRDYRGDFRTFWMYFKQNSLPMTPYWAHVNEAWKLRHRPNFKFLFYEQILADMDSTLRDLSNFLGVQYTAGQLSQLRQHLNISSFRANKSVNNDELKAVGILRDNGPEEGFVRKGKPCEWKLYFQNDLKLDLSAWMNDNLAKYSIAFPEAKSFD